MIKKHLIIYSASLVLLTVFNLLFFSTPAERSSANVIRAKMPETKSEPKTEKVPRYTFANEAVPAKNPKVAYRMERALKAHSYDKLQTHKLHKKAAEWFPVIEPILRSYGIPEDFKYMPLVESGLKSGTSPKGAAGYWQFMPETARHFGLRVDGKVDERHNVRKSTVAACKYIRALYREFGSWTLAAAAYNIGENRLKRHMSKQEEDNYFKMKLNRETATYVYKLVSMKEIIENPLSHGYKSKKVVVVPKTVSPIQRFSPETEPKHLLAFNLIQY